MSGPDNTFIRKKWSIKLKRLGACIFNESSSVQETEITLFLLWRLVTKCMLHAAFCLKHRSLFLPTIYQVIDRPHQQKCANLRVTVKMNITNVPNRTADSLPTLLLLQVIYKRQSKSNSSCRQKHRWAFCLPMLEIKIPSVMSLKTQ